VPRMLAVFTAFAAFTAFSLATPAPKPVLYFPTKAGAKWVYDDDGQTYTLVVTKAEPKDAATLVTVGLVDPDGLITHFQTMEVSPRGLREVENHGRKCHPPVPHLRLPHTPGAQWQSPLALDGEARGINEMRAGAVEQVRVPAGTFQAVRVDTLSTSPGGQQQRLTHWYAPGVGLVRVTYRPGSSRDLKSFEPGR
jgi:hypothetical protein